MKKVNWGVPPCGEREIISDIEGYTTILIEHSLISCLYFVKGDKLLYIEEGKVYDTKGITHIKDETINPEDARPRKSYMIVNALLS